MRTIPVRATVDRTQPISLNDFVVRADIFDAYKKLMPLMVDVSPQVMETVQQFIKTHKLSPNVEPGEGHKKVLHAISAIRALRVHAFDDDMESTESAGNTAKVTSEEFNDKKLLALLASLRYVEPGVLKLIVTLVEESLDTPSKSCACLQARFFSLSHIRMYFLVSYKQLKRLLPSLKHVHTWVLQECVRLFRKEWNRDKEFQSNKNICLVLAPVGRDSLGMENYKEHEVLEKLKLYEKACSPIHLRDAVVNILPHLQVRIKKNTQEQSWYIMNAHSLILFKITHILCRTLTTVCFPAWNVCFIGRARACRIHIA